MKKHNKILLIITVIIAYALLLLAVYLGFNNRKKIEMLTNTVTAEAAAREFAIREINNGNVFFDKIYIKKDTVFFYKNDTLMGSSVILGSSVTYK